MEQTENLARKYHLLGIRKGLDLGLKVRKQFQNQNKPEDWTLGSNPPGNGHVTH